MHHMQIKDFTTFAVYANNYAMSTTPLRQARKDRGLTLKEAADLIGIEITKLSRMERGHSITKETVKDEVPKLVQFYGNGLTEMHILYPERYPVMEVVNQ